MARGLAALVVGIALLGGTTALRAQATEVVGTLYGVWGDPLRAGERPRLIHSVLTDDGRSVPVVLDVREAAPHGGLAAVDRQRVRLALAGDRVAAIRSVAAPARVGLRALFDGVADPRRYVTLLCRFPDFPDVVPGTIADAERAFGTAYPGTGHFWNEVSDGRITMDGSIVRGWYTLPGSKDSYVGQSTPSLNTLARDCANAADADVFFPDFAGVNFVFNTDIGCCFWGGAGGLFNDGGARSYAMTWLGGSALRSVGSAAHEIGHSFGLQHSSGPYGLVYDSKWDVMSTSVWHPVPGTDVLVGAQVNAYGKRQLGWIPPARDRLIEPGTHEVMIERSALPAENGHLLVARIPAPRFGPGQYYTLEARGIGGYDAPLPGAGIVIHRVGGGGPSPSNVVDPDGDFDPSDLGAVLEPGERFEDRVNGITVTVLERVGDAFRVAIVAGDYPRVSLAAPLRTLSVPAGDAAPVADSAALTVGGLAADAPWTARSVFAGPLALATTSGTGSGMLRWTLQTAGLAPGNYFQEVRVDLGGGASARLEVRLTVTAPVALTATVLATSTRDSVIAGDSARSAWNSVVPVGAGAATATWTATSTTPWITVDSASGTGSGVLVHSRNSAGLPPGWHVGTVAVDVAGATPSRVTVTDSLLVLEAPVITVAPRTVTRRAMSQGAAPVRDSLHVSFSGRWATGASWFAFQSSGGGYVVSGAAPRGSGWVHFTRAPRDLAPGTYPARILVAMLHDSQSLRVLLDDTLDVVAAPSTLVLSKPVARDSVRGTTSISEDSVFVHPAGPSSSTRTWAADAPPTRLGFPLRGSSIPNQFTGPAWIRWIRNLDGRAPGWHVDTIRFAFVGGAGSGAMLVDSLFIAPPPTPATLVIAGLSRRVEARAGTTTPLVDSADVVLTGEGAASVPWRATAVAPWLSLTTAEGAGPGRVRWSRSPAGLAVGWHVDTIRVAAAAVGSPVRLVDSLRIHAPLAIVDVTEPALTMGAAYARTLTTTGGPSTAVQWGVVAGALPPGLALDPVTGTLAGVVAGSGDFAFTVRARAPTDSADRALALTVTEPVLAAPSVVEQLLGGDALTADQRRYLDLQGNRNGRVDVGDVRAWRRRQAAALTAAGRAAVDSVLAPGRRP